MEYKTREIKQGIKLHLMKTEEYKTNLISVFLTTELKKKTATENALIPAVLRRGTQTLKTQEEINIKLEELYGAEYDGGVEKIGDNQIIKFYIESISNKFLPNNEDILNESIDLLLDIILNPLIEKGTLKNEYVDGEKKNLKQIIELRVDDKNMYSLDRCIEEIYKNQEYATYKYGDIEDIKNITSESLYRRYLELLNSCKIDIFISGDFDETKINLKKIEQLKEREPEYIRNSEDNNKKQRQEQINTVEEKKDVVQGKLVVGLDLLDVSGKDRFKIALYNTILGESPTSKLFQNVREKANLAYSTRSSYIRQKNNIYIRNGIDIPNYQKALEIITQQLEEMKKGEFSEEDINNAKKYIISAVKSILAEQDTCIIYYIGQELSGYNLTFEEYERKINEITKKDILEIANKVQINTIYFLKN